MRIIEQKMLAAVNGGYDWKQGNTRVIHSKISQLTVVYLYNKRIAAFDKITGKWEYSCCGYHTATTRSRLRALGCDCRIKNSRLVGVDSHEISVWRGVQFFEFTAPNGKKYAFRCWSYKTRNSWGHWCEVLDVDNYYNTICKCRVRYYNRTWEAYKFQSVAVQAVEKAFKRKSDTETREAALKFFHDTTNKL